MATATKNPAPTAEGEETAAKGGKKKKLIMVLVLLLVAGGAGYWFVLKPKEAGPKKPDPGVVVPLDDIQINLAADHYLKIGLALQASKDAGEAVDGSKALDDTIALFSGQNMQDLARRDYRARLKKQLEKRLDKDYEGKVIGVYFTDFVTQ
jgi:flagellar protein FliL